MARFIGTILSVLFSLSLIALSWAYWSLWRDPSRIHALSVPELMGIMLVEFIVIHSSALLLRMTYSRETTRQKVKVLSGFLALYSVFAAGFAFGFRAPWLLLSFLGLTLVRLPSVLLSRPNDKARFKAAGKDWAFAAVMYLLGAGATTVLPIPRFGITPEVVNGLDLPSEGLWVEEPHRVLAFGCFYFALLGIRDLVTAFRTSVSDAEDASPSSTD